MMSVDGEWKQGPQGPPSGIGQSSRLPSGERRVLGVGGDGRACWWIRPRPHLDSLPLAFGQTCIQTTLSDDD